MIIILFALLGAAYGGFKAKKNGGNRWDIAQYAASFAIACAVLGLFVTVILGRSV
ncbi:MAG: hypothetical protein ACPGNV_11945 [Mangrovicoccus sp.]